MSETECWPKLWAYAQPSTGRFYSCDGLELDITGQQDKQNYNKPTLPQSRWEDELAEAILAFFLLSFNFSPAKTTSLASLRHSGQYLELDRKKLFGFKLFKLHNKRFNVKQVYIKTCSTASNSNIAFPSGLTCFD